MNTALLTIALAQSVPAATNVPPAADSAMSMPRASPTAEDPQLVATSMELSVLLNSEELVRAVTGRMLQGSLKQSLQASSDFLAMEKRWPGITDEFIATIGPLLTKAALNRVPQFQRDAAAIYREHLTQDDMVALLTFYKSPPGQRMIASIKANAEIGSLLDSQINSPEKTSIAASEVNKVIDNTSSQVIGSQSLEDRFALMQFAATPAGRKLKSISGPLRELSVRSANQTDPAAEAEVATAVKALIRRHMDADAARAPSKQASQ